MIAFYTSVEFKCSVFHVVSVINNKRCGNSTDSYAFAFFLQTVFPLRSFGIGYGDYPPLGSELVGRTSPGPGFCRYDFGKNLPQCARLPSLSCSARACIPRPLLFPSHGLQSARCDWGCGRVCSMDLSHKKVCTAVEESARRTRRTKKSLHGRASWGTSKSRGIASRGK